MLVTDAERGSSIAVIRALGKGGYCVIAADANPKSIGFRSRYVDDILVYPSPEHDSAGFIECLRKAAIARQIDLVIPVTEMVIQPLMRVREDIESVTRLALPANRLLAEVTDKLRTIELARGLGIPVPDTYLANGTREAITLVKHLTWPVVVKPITSARLCPSGHIEKFEVSYAPGPEDLERVTRRFEGKCPVLLQRYYPGVGYGVELLMSQGEPIAAFAHKRLREFPITGGASSFRESVTLDEKLYGYSVSLLKKLEWSGLAMVEFKVDGSNPVLMEINGRMWGSMPLAIWSGVNFPLLLTKLFLDGRESISPQLNGGYKVGLRCRDLQKDLMWIASVLLQRRKYPFLKTPKRSQALGALAGFLNPMHKFDLLCLDDPIPGLAELPKILLKFKEKIRD